MEPVVQGYYSIIQTISLPWFFFMIWFPFQMMFFQYDNKIVPQFTWLHDFREWEISFIIHLRTDHYMHANKSSELVKGVLKSIRMNSDWRSHKAENSDFCHQPDWKNIKINGKQDGMHKKGSCLSSIISPGFCPCPE